MQESIFKAYDIRGIYPTELDEQTAYDIGRAYASYVQKNSPSKVITMVVGGDMRISTPTLKESVVQGLLESGCDVMDVGLVSTPVFYYCVAFYGHDGGMQVSASHNPKEYNGIKIAGAQAMAIGRDSGMDDVKAIALSGDFVKPQRIGRLFQQSQRTQASQKEQTRSIPIKKIKPFHIVVDTANGMGVQDVEAIIGRLPCEVMKLNFPLDGTFPAHPADPLDPKNDQQLSDAIITQNADVGIALDGDADRIFFLDEHGDILRPEVIRSIIAERVLQEHPGATICCDIRPGRITHDVVQRAGGRVVVAKAGSALMKVVMLKENALFGGESSGHYFFRFPYGTFEAPMVLMLLFLVWLSEQNIPLSEAVRPYQKYFHSGEQNFSVRNVQATLARVQNHYHDADINLLDGVTVTYPDWWFNVRGSNTEPLVRLNLEARSKELMEQKRDEVLGVIRA